MLREYKPDFEDHLFSEGWHRAKFKCNCTQVTFSRYEGLIKGARYTVVIGDEVISDITHTIDICFEAQS